jgi:hypothetical protein
MKYSLVDFSATGSGVSFPSPKFIIFDSGQRRKLPSGGHPLQRNVTHLFITYADLGIIISQLCSQLDESRRLQRWSLS